MQQTIFPAVRYRDAEAALRFLRTAFSAVERDVFRNDAGTIQHSEILIEGSVIFVAQFGEEPTPGGEPPRPLASTQSLYLLVADPDAHRARAVAAGATVVRELEDTDYGSRQYSVRDPEGNLWSFGTYDPSAVVAD